MIDDGPDEDEALLVEFGEGGLEISGGHFVEAKLDGFDHAFVEETGEIALVFTGELRSAGGDVHEVALAVDFVAIADDKRVDEEVDVGVADFVDGNFTGGTDDE